MTVTTSSPMPCSKMSLTPKVLWNSAQGCSGEPWRAGATLGTAATMGRANPMAGKDLWCQDALLPAMPAACRGRGKEGIWLPRRLATHGVRPPATRCVPRVAQTRRGSLGQPWAECLNTFGVGLPAMVVGLLFVRCTLIKMWVKLRPIAAEPAWHSSAWGGGESPRAG